MVVQQNKALCRPPPPPGNWVTELGWTPHPVRVTIRDDRDNIKVLVYSYDTTISGRGLSSEYIYTLNASIAALCSRFSKPFITPGPHKVDSKPFTPMNCPSRLKQSILSYPRFGTLDTYLADFRFEGFIVPVK